MTNFLQNKITQDRDYFLWFSTRTYSWTSLIARENNTMTLNFYSLHISYIVYLILNIYYLFSKYKITFRKQNLLAISLLLNLCLGWVFFWGTCKVWNEERNETYGNETKRYDSRSQIQSKTKRNQTRTKWNETNRKKWNRNRSMWNQS